MDKTPVIDKIKKLLALADSCNEHEAALAAAHAQRLLAAHPCPTTKTKGYSMDAVTF